VDNVERITSGGRLLACIIRAEADAEKTTFLTPPEANVQVGFVARPAGEEIAAHAHRPVERHLRGTFEVLVVRRGRCEVDFYDDTRRCVATRELRPGDTVFIVGGGHGFRVLEDLVLTEIKQGPYGGLGEKETF
jgi:mannose-6-phosphate isomerase-like protein (cupin superfamily)